MPLTEEEREKANDTDRLLDLMRSELEIGERVVFTAAGVTGLIGGYLNALHTCPDCVIEYCQRALQPGSPERLAQGRSLKR